MSTPSRARALRSTCASTPWTAPAAPTTGRQLQQPSTSPPQPQPQPPSQLPHQSRPLSTTVPAQPAVNFHSHPPLSFPSSADPDQKPPDKDRKVKLGKTLRTLQSHLPTILLSPLPQEILSPSITLHLFPSTHPHLPAVSGRISYIAALLSSPIAWNRLPLVGNVRLEILSERMIKDPHYSSPAFRQTRPKDAFGEQLIVRWRTTGGKQKLGKAKGEKNGWLPWEKDDGGKQGGVDTEYKAPVGTAQGVGSGKEFTGLFIFDFDTEGRIISHTIEHVEQGGQWERGVGAKVVGLTDWLLGGFRGGDGGAPCPAFAGNRGGCFEGSGKGR
ncbi:hypothetical protein QC762_307685 [Podospora pseudocomata]|uniref:Chromosome transmission fidelity protein 4 n=2 Tax=Podospora TaxID=5144 RepID=A0ABR0GK69_9PEZI|nr:hypothetical protein QC761_307685 [Podospora bellae-mahoneyi]KAK4656032.1 hypothetical protein QC762_307685 [Podospora pseudocomata]